MTRAEHDAPTSSSSPTPSDAAAEKTQDTAMRHESGTEVADGQLDEIAGGRYRPYEPQVYPDPRKTNEVII